MHDTLGECCERELAELGIELLRPSFKREKQRFGKPILKKVRHLIESVNDTLKSKLNLEQHGGRTFEGVAIRMAQRVLAMAAGIWQQQDRCPGHPFAGRLRPLTRIGHPPPVHRVGMPPCGLLTTNDKDPSTR